MHAKKFKGSLSNLPFFFLSNLTQLSRNSAQEQRESCPTFWVHEKKTIGCKVISDEWMIRHKIQFTRYQYFQNFKLLGIGEFNYLIII